MSEFIHLFLRQAGKEIDEKASGTTFKEVSGKQVAHVLVPLPPLAEQKRIVVKVDELMRLCDELEAQQSLRQSARVHLNGAALNALQSADEADFPRRWGFVREHFELLYEDPQNVQALRKAVLQLAVRGKLVEQNSADESASTLLERIEEEKQRLYKEGKIRKPKKLSPVRHQEHSFEVPEGWVWARLGQLLSEPLSNGKSVKDRSGGFPVLRLSALQGGSIITSEAKEGDWVREEAEPYVIRVGDFLLARGNGSLSLVGRGALVEEESNPVAFPDTMIRVRVAGAACKPDYLRLVWNSPGVRANIEEHARSTSGLHKINQTHVREAVLPLPPLAEQQRIIDKVDELMRLCNELEAQLVRSQEKATGLLEAVRGVMEDISETAALA